MENMNDAIQRAPMPTGGTLKHRRNVLVQLWKFVTLNLNILRMVVKGHK